LILTATTAVATAMRVGPKISGSISAAGRGLPTANEARSASGSIRATAEEIQSVRQGVLGTKTA